MEKTNKSISGFLITFLALMGFWLLLSGYYDLAHISMGVVASLLIAYITHDLFLRRSGLDGLHIEVFRFSRYIFWHLTEIIKANINVAKIVLNPNLPISPTFVKHSPDLEKGMAITVFGNSITLTPGTLTVNVDEDNDIYIHCLTSDHYQEMVESGMEERVKHIFREDED
ncbi:Na+/H+ antiporter subunit E [Methanonatronarchaeum sp. AMET-Sl]|uniref:Na+/H+ antiporter subunit E n=1 Tax=Methanonatronarchaeum sp. AMET-Sl TaxID=3037654 RepID=UPI00244E03F9|nr:Na+/H+ antiporter subunit E [Methanonatronarchaeum sp. AMET-Sl]WGI17504.1 Na+/H+ antiporter subunit E [Methanonatronarchaeum sp. AMET-Sl]